jgi:hypothetical protein
LWGKAEEEIFVFWSRKTAAGFNKKISITFKEKKKKKKKKKKKNAQTTEESPRRRGGGGGG